MKLGCVVMAAGESRRFGANKLLHPFAGVPLYVRALGAVPEGVFEAVCVVTAFGQVADLARQRGFRVVSNEQPEQGISRTIRLGLQALADLDGVLFMTADQPLLTVRTVENLAEAFLRTPDCILAAASDGRRGNPCLFPRSLLPELLALEGDTGGSRVIKAHPDRLRLLEVPARELADCDTAEKLEALEKAVLQNGL